MASFSGSFSSGSFSTDTGATPAAVAAPQRRTWKRKYLIVCPPEEEEIPPLPVIELPKRKFVPKKYLVDARRIKPESVDVARLVMSPYIEIKIPKFDEPKQLTEEEWLLLFH